MKDRRSERATDRELAVVAAVVAAGSEKAAAHRLGLSHSTVKHHLASARFKVGATTTAQLVWFLAEWLPQPEDGGRRNGESSSQGRQTGPSGRGKHDCVAGDRKSPMPP